jgi:hypothetical protein
MNNNNNRNRRHVHFVNARGSGGRNRGTHDGANQFDFIIIHLASQNTNRHNRFDRNRSFNSEFESDLPGFYYDTNKRRYFRLQPDTPGASYSLDELNRQKRDRDRLALFTNGRGQHLNRSKDNRSMCALFGNMQMGSVGRMKARRSYSESIVLNASAEPTSVCPVIILFLVLLLYSSDFI